MNPLNVTSSVCHYCGARNSSHQTVVIRTITKWAYKRGAEKELCEKKWKIKAEAVEKKGLIYWHVQYANQITLSLTASFMSIITASSLQGSN